MYSDYRVFAGTDREGQSPASCSLSAGLTAQESPWLGLRPGPTGSLLRLLPVGPRAVPPGEEDPGLRLLTDMSLQELGIRTEQVQERSPPRDPELGVRAAFSRFVLGCTDRPGPGAVRTSGLRAGLERFRGETWTRTEVCEPTEAQTLETPKPLEVLHTWTPQDRSQEGVVQPQLTTRPRPQKENLQEAPVDEDPTPPQNKAIAFIMGFPCSDHDDGFDSEGSSSSSSSSSDDDDDDGESDRLLHSLCLTSDPYNPQCFTAPLHTGRPSDLQAPLCSGGVQAPPPQYRSDEAAERLDSGFSEFTPSAKKVRFHDNVEEITCEAEDRRGVWEELARDRLRFQHRCQEAELKLAPCLQPQHRHEVYQRLQRDSAHRQVGHSSAPQSFMNAPQ